MMMKQGAIKIILLTFVTCGFYALYWLYKTGAEMRERGADIPPFWYKLIPILNVIWLWKWAKGVEFVSGGKTSGAMLFVVFLFFFPATIFMAQNALNQV